MGLLDDAIREHLDLKRKHGAKEEELDRQETEALGPARRDFTTEGAHTDEAAAAPVAEEAVAAPEAAPEPAGWLDEEHGEVPFDAAAEAAPETAPPVREPAPKAVEPPVPEPIEPAAQPRRESDTPPQGFPAISRDDEQLGRDDEPPPEGEEDVLEETPDFLQDTPEHDRLWFEQKPPRDFDFDG